MGLPRRFRSFREILTYTFSIFESKTTIIPLMSGSVTYTIRTLKQKVDNAYSVTASIEIIATLTNELSIYLYPSQIVDYDKDTLTVKKSFELTK